MVNVFAGYHPATPFGILAQFAELHFGVLVTLG
jgi:hypothetical protein